jgi:hypothetical protein
MPSEVGDETRGAGCVEGRTAPFLRFGADVVQTGAPGCARRDASGKTWIAATRARNCTGGVSRFSEVGGRNGRANNWMAA